MNNNKSLKKIFFVILLTNSFNTFSIDWKNWLVAQATTAAVSASTRVAQPLVKKAVEVGWPLVKEYWIPALPPVAMGAYCLILKAKLALMNADVQVIKETLEKVRAGVSRIEMGQELLIDDIGKVARGLSHHHEFTQNQFLRVHATMRDLKGLLNGRADKLERKLEEFRGEHHQDLAKIQSEIRALRKSIRRNDPSTKNGTPQRWEDFLPRSRMRFPALEYKQ